MKACGLNSEWIASYEYIVKGRRGLTCALLVIIQSQLYQHHHSVETKDAMRKIHKSHCNIISMG